MHQKDEANKSAPSKKIKADTPPQRRIRKTKTACKVMLHDKIKLRMILKKYFIDISLIRCLITIFIFFIFL